MSRDRLFFVVPMLSFLLLILATATLAEPATEQGTWPRWSGPNFDLSTDTGRLGDGPVELEVAWTIELGSGYSGIVVADGKVITGFTDEGATGEDSSGPGDFLGAFDTATGTEVWRHRLGEIYEAHDGSDDGPIATPLIHDGVVYGLGAWGELVALSLEDGQPLWQLDLDDLGGRKPHYGYSSNPTLVGNTLVIQTGGTDGKSIQGLDPRTGEVRWSTGNDLVGHQSPAALTVDGVEMVLAVTNAHLYGLDPATGDELWHWAHGGEDDDDGSAQPVSMGDGRVLLANFQDVAMVRVARAGGEWQIEELWKGNGLRNTWAYPVPRGEHVYGFAGRFLTALDAATGETVWKSRPPGGGNLVLVDDHLVIQSSEGELVVAAASPEGYQEKARIAVLDEGYLTTPSVAGGRVFLRNLSQMGAVDIRRGSGDPTTAAAADLPDEALVGNFGDFIRQLLASEPADRHARAEAFIAEQEEFPIVESDRLVHFVFHGETPDIALGTNFAANQQLEMHRVPGTDLYFHSALLEPASHYTYSFFEFEESKVDPRNPRTFGPEETVQSVVTTPGWQTPDHFAVPTGEPGEGGRGRIETFTWTSEILENEREVRIYLPPGHSAEDGDYPLVVFNYGNLALDEGHLDHSLDHLLGDRVEPLVAAFVPRVDWNEVAGTRVAEYGQALAEELLPRLREDFGITDEAGRRGIFGPVGGAMGSIYPTFAQPGTFGKVAVLSFYFGDRQEELETMIAEGPEEGTEPIEVFAVWSRQDYQFRALDARLHGPQLVAQLREHGHRAASLELGDGFGWPMWRRALAPVLERFFPLPR